MIEHPWADVTTLTRNERDREAGVDLVLDISAELSVFRGHFTGVSLLAGVVQVDWAIAYARKHFSFPPDFLKASSLKFTRVIRPGDRLTLALRWQEAAGELFFRYCDGRGDFSSGFLFFGHSAPRSDDEAHV